jgi:hypothetical protein
MERSKSIAAAASDDRFAAAGVLTPGILTAVVGTLTLVHIRNNAQFDMILSVAYDGYEMLTRGANFTD